MSEWRSFATLLRGPKSDVAVLLATFLLTVIVDLTVAVQAGVILAAFLFILLNGVGDRLTEIVTGRKLRADNDRAKDDRPTGHPDSEKLPAHFGILPSEPSASME